MDDFSSSLITFRIAERAIVSFVVIVISIVVTVGFWKSLQRLDFNLTKGTLGAGGSAVLGTPVLAMLALIGFSWVNFSNPIAYEAAPTPSPEPMQTAAAPEPAVRFRGSAADPSAQAAATRRDRVRQVVRVLNCIPGENELQTDALRQARLSLMGQVWDQAWGPADAFDTWVLIGQGAPDPEAKAFFEEARMPC
jgi:hypothetical protein